jgi:hypothetical protein
MLVREFAIPMFWGKKIPGRSTREVVEAGVMKPSRWF